MDRIVDLNGIPDEYIRTHHYDYLLEDDYLTPEAVLVDNAEQTAFKLAAGQLYRLFQEELVELLRSDNLAMLGLPPLMNELIKYTWEHGHKHLLGRFDFAGGIDGDVIKLLELNADTPTMIPESGGVQREFLKEYSRKDTGQFNTLEEDLEKAFAKLADINAGSHHSMLFTTLGYPEDIANLQPLMEAAEAAGFVVTYADLPDVQFAPGEGVFLEDEDGTYIQYDYLYKLFPWEFACFEEPELLADLHSLIMNDLVYVVNPAYALVFQSKQFLTHVAERNVGHKHLLKSSSSKTAFAGEKYVEKVTFGRLGQNIKIVDESGRTIESTDGDYDEYPTVYQAFAELYKDEDGDLYQPSVFMVDGVPSCLSFRRGEKLIIDDDAQFIPHITLP